MLHRWSWSARRNRELENDTEILRLERVILAAHTTVTELIAEGQPEPTRSALFELAAILQQGAFHRDPDRRH